MRGLCCNGPAEEMHRTSVSSFSWDQWTMVAKYALHTRCKSSRCTAALCLCGSQGWLCRKHLARMATDRSGARWSTVLPKGGAPLTMWCANASMPQLPLPCVRTLPMCSVGMLMFASMCHAGSHALSDGAAHGPPDSTHWRAA